MRYMEILEAEEITGLILSQTVTIHVGFCPFSFELNISILIFSLHYFGLASTTR